MNVKQFYEAVNGNYVAALDTMMMDSFIIKMLTKFNEKNSFDALKESYLNEDYRGVFEAAHSLKGVVGNLALTDLFNKVVPVVEAVRNYTPNQKVDIKGDFEKLEESYNLVIENIKTLIA